MAASRFRSPKKLRPTTTPHRPAAHRVTTGVVLRKSKTGLRNKRKSVQRAVRKELRRKREAAILAAGGGR